MAWTRKNRRHAMQSSALLRTEYIAFGQETRETPAQIILLISSDARELSTWRRKSPRDGNHRGQTYISVP